MAEAEGAENLKAHLDMISKENAFYKKYFALRKRCEQLQQSNEKMVNRIQHAKKLIKRYKRDRRYLTSRLDDYGDNFRDVRIPYMWEEDQLLGNVRASALNAGAGSDTDGEKRVKLEPKSALSSIQPLLQAHGLGQLDSSGKTRKIKVEKEKDPNAPKKPANAFLMFCQTQRTSVQEEYFKEHKEEMAHHELTKSLAQHWNALVPEEKRIYYDMYEREKERYEREMRNYKPKQEATTESTSSVATETGTSKLETPAIKTEIE